MSNIKKFTQGDIRERLATIILAAKGARKALNAGRDVFQYVENIHCDINDLHESMDEGVTPTKFKVGKPTVGW